MSEPRRNDFAWTRLKLLSILLLQMDHYVKGKNLEEEEVVPEDLISVLPEHFQWYFRCLDVYSMDYWSLSHKH